MGKKYRLPRRFVGNAEMGQGGTRIGSLPSDFKVLFSRKIGNIQGRRGARRISARSAALEVRSRQKIGGGRIDVRRTAASVPLRSPFSNNQNRIPRRSARYADFFAKQI